MISEPTTTLPTEPGWYLFFGSWASHDVAAQLRRTRPELVQVGQDAMGKLVYLGRDIRYPGAQTVGLWARLDVSQPVEAARPILAQAAAVEEVRSALRYDGYARTREWIEDQVQRSGHYSPEVAREIVAVAIETGVLIEDERPGHFRRGS